FSFRRSLLRRRHARRQLHDPDVPEKYFRPLGFHAEVALLLRGVADAVDELAVHREFEDAIHGDYIIRVPLPPAQAAVFDGHAPRAAGVVGHDLQAAHTEELTVH